MTRTAAARTQLEMASRALMAALRAQSVSTRDDDLRSLLDASRAAVQREAQALGPASCAAIARKVGELEWRLAVLVGDWTPTADPSPPRSGRDADLTDFLVDAPAGER